MAERYDLVVIGAGPGGYVAAIRAAQLGMKVACVEKAAALGGTCLRVGCIPSKALLDSSEFYHLAEAKFARHGIKVGGLEIDLPTMHKRKDGVVKGLTDGVAYLFKKNKITPVFGTATLTSPTAVKVAGNDGKSVDLEAGHILLATGSEPINLPFMPFDGNTIVSSTEALCFDKVPNHLLVVGGGAIGLELGSVWRRLGSKVTVVEFLPRIVPSSDFEVGDILRKSLTKQGLEILTETRVSGAEITPNGGAKVTAQDKENKTLTFACDKVLVSVGRRAYSEGLGLAEAGVTADPKSGKVPVDKHFRTNVPTISAIGDLIAGPMLAHKAEDEGVAVAEIIAGQAGHVNYDVIPSVVYTAPEIASVGRTEEELKSAGIDYKVGKFPFTANGRARAMLHTDGFVKILSAKSDDRVLGFHIVGFGAGEMIHEGAVLMEFGGSAEDLARTCHAHPTMSEAVREAAMAAAFGKPIHI